MRITEATEYPFRETVTFKVKLARPQTFALHLRIPEWCEAASVRVNGKAAAVDTKAGSFALLKRQFRDGDVVTLHLPMQVAVERWFGGRAGVVRCGALAYSLAVAERRVESTQEPEVIRRVLKRNNVEGFPSVEFFPAGEWRYGMDAGLAENIGRFQVKESPMPENPFVAGTAPVQMTALLRTLPGWAAD